VNAGLVKYGKIGHYAEVVLALYLSWQYWSLWHSPSLDSAPELHVLIGIVIFELFVIQSGLVVSILPRWASILYLIVFIGGYAWLFSQWLPGPRIAVIYLFVLLNRGVYIFADREERNTRIIRWYTGIAYGYFMLLLVISATMSNAIPVFALDAPYLGLSGYWDWPIAHKGLLFEKPHLGMFLGTTVYFGISILEIARIRGAGPFKLKT
jgi:hypothetical protein